MNKKMTNIPQQNLLYLTKKRKFSEHIESHHRMPDGKLIAMVQVCIRCGKTFQPTRGRTHCPRCQGILRNKNTVLQVQQVF